MYAQKGMYTQKGHSSKGHSSKGQSSKGHSSKSYVGQGKIPAQQDDCSPGECMADWVNTVKSWRILVVLFVVALAVLLCIFTHDVIREGERNQAEQEYDVVADSFLMNIQSAIEARVSVTATMVTILSYQQNGSWPFVTLDGYETIAMKVLDSASYSGSPTQNAASTSIYESIAFGPLVDADDIDSFETFAFNYFESVFPNSTVVNSFGNGVYDVTSDGDKLYTTLDDDSSITRESRALPVLQNSTGASQLLMFNAFNASQGRGDDLLNAIQCASSVMLDDEGTRSCTVVSDFVEYVDDDFVGFVVSDAVYPAASPDRVTGGVIATFSWADALFEASKGQLSTHDVDFIVATPSVSHVYRRVSGGNDAGIVTYAGTMDRRLASDSLSSYSRYIDPFGSVTGTVNNTLSAAYTVTIRPRGSYFDDQESDTPIIAVVVIIVIACMVVGLFVVREYVTSTQIKAQGKKLEANGRFIRILGQESHTSLQSANDALLSLEGEIEDVLRNVDSWKRMEVSHRSQVSATHRSQVSQCSSPIHGQPRHVPTVPVIHIPPAHRHPYVCQRGGEPLSARFQDSTLAPPVTARQDMPQDLLSSTRSGQFTTRSDHRTYRESELQLAAWMKLVQSIKTEMACTTSVLTQSETYDATSKEATDLEKSIFPVWSLIESSVSQYQTIAKKRRISLDLNLGNMPSRIDMFNFFNGSACEKRREALEFMIPQNLRDQYVLGDRVKVSQVIRNLLSTAVQTTVDGGFVLVSLSWRNKRDASPASMQEVKDGAKVMAYEAGMLEVVVQDSGGTLASDMICKAYESRVMDEFGVPQKGTPIPSYLSAGGQNLIASSRKSSSSVVHRDVTGLIISKHIVEAHGGSLTVESEAGKGCTLTALIPLYHIEDEHLPANLRSARDDREREALIRSAVEVVLTPRAGFNPIGDAGAHAGTGGITEALAREQVKPVNHIRTLHPSVITRMDASKTHTHTHDVVARQGRQPLIRPRHILIVDSNAASRRLVGQMLQKAGHTFTEAQDGRDAMDKYTHGVQTSVVYDAILLGSNMQGLDAPSTAKALRERNCACIIIGMSDGLVPDSSPKLKANGANAVLKCPLNMVELMKVLDSVKVGNEAGGNRQSTMVSPTVEPLPINNMLNGGEVGGLYYMLAQWSAKDDDIDDLDVDIQASKSQSNGEDDPLAEMMMMKQGQGHGMPTCEQAEAEVDLLVSGSTQKLSARLSARQESSSQARSARDPMPMPIPNGASGGKEDIDHARVSDMSDGHVGSAAHDNVAVYVAGVRQAPDVSMHVNNVNNACVEESTSPRDSYSVKSTPPREYTMSFNAAGSSASSMVSTRRNSFVSSPVMRSDTMSTVRNSRSNSYAGTTDTRLLIDLARASGRDSAAKVPARGERYLETNSFSPQKESVTLAPAFNKGTGLNSYLNLNALSLRRNSTGKLYDRVNGSAGKEMDEEMAADHTNECQDVNAVGGGVLSRNASTYSISSSSAVTRANSTYGFSTKSNQSSTTVGRPSVPMSRRGSRGDLSLGISRESSGRGFGLKTDKLNYHQDSTYSPPSESVSKKVFDESCIHSNADGYSYGSARTAKQASCESLYDVDAAVSKNPAQDAAFSFGGMSSDIGGYDYSDIDGLASAREARTGDVVAELSYMKRQPRSGRSGHKNSAGTGNTPRQANNNVAVVRPSTLSNLMRYRIHPGAS